MPIPLIWKTGLSHWWIWVTTIGLYVTGYIDSCYIGCMIAVLFPQRFAFSLSLCIWAKGGLFEMGRLSRCWILMYLCFPRIFLFVSVAQSRFPLIIKRPNCASSAHHSLSLHTSLSLILQTQYSPGERSERAALPPCFVWMFTLLSFIHFSAFCSL